MRKCPHFARRRCTAARMKLILALFLFFGLSLADLTCNCGWRNTGRIVGGKEARKNEYPWMVSLKFKEQNFHTCGGSILTPWHVLTAAHCVFARRPDEFVIVVGGHDLKINWEQNSNSHLVQSIIMHPAYTKDTMHNDIAILVTSTEIKFSKFVGPVCLPNRNLGDRLVGQYLKATGWGMLGQNEQNNMKILREVDLQVISTNECRRQTPDGHYSGKQICTFTQKKDICMGDSGGPLVYLDPETNRFTQAALVSWVYCGRVAGPSTNTDVSSYIGWIENEVKRTKNSFTCHKK